MLSGAKNQLTVKVSTLSNECCQSYTVDLYGDYGGEKLQALSIITHEINKLWSWELSQSIHNELENPVSHKF